MQKLKQWIKRSFGRFIYRRQLSAVSKQNLLSWREARKGKKLEYLWEASYDVFTYHGEDGIIYYLLDQMENVPRVFVDIGSGDCIKSNCANLVNHFGWKGLFVDADPAQLSVGKSFYKHKLEKGVIKMVQAEVTPSNVNELLDETLLKQGVGLLSIDIDGNDYWVWKAIENIQPRLVIIEAKVEFGYRNLVVPFGRSNHRGVDVEYNGASIGALKMLGEQKGYKLVGANKDGYNLFFVRQDENIAASPMEKIIDEKALADTTYPDTFFSSHTFVTE